MIVGRFAPSPSGRMHLGNVFTALLAWLSVRSRKGKMLLRIEDLDPDRSKPEYIRALREDLLWLGLDWDEEMPLQSTRTVFYEEQFSRLPVYPCYCTRNELHAASAPHASDGTPIYAGTCRNLSQEERSAKIKVPAWRVKAPDLEIEFQDGLQGSVRENLLRECGDFILRRSDGVYAYQLAVVCDDGDGGVTEVVRGRDLLGSTARQLWLYDSLGFERPRFYHVPLLVAPDGRRLSKRERDLDMEHLRKQWKPETLIGYLAYLAGQTDQPESITPTELKNCFCWERVPRSNIPILNIMKECGKL